MIRVYTLRLVVAGLPRVGWFWTGGVSLVRCGETVVRVRGESVRFGTGVVDEWDCAVLFAVVLIGSERGFEHPPEYTGPEQRLRSTL